MRMYVITLNPTDSLFSLRYADVRQAILVFFDSAKIIHFVDCIKKNPLMIRSLHLDLHEISIFGKEQMVEMIESMFSPNEKEMVDIFFEGDEHFLTFYREITGGHQDTGKSVLDVFDRAYTMVHPSMNLSQE